MMDYPLTINKNLRGIMKRPEDVKILVVDDNQAAQEILTYCLRRRGYAVPKIASNGVEALALIEKSLKEENHFDIIFLDIWMPKMDGVETTKRIRQIPRYKNTPIIAMSATGIKDDKKMCLEAGATDFIFLPTSLGIYPEKIRKYCQ